MKIKKMTIRKNITIMAVAAFMLAACQESLEDRCIRECRQYTQKNCPARFDDNTILDSMTFDRATHTLHYYFTLAGTADSIGVLNEAEARKALLGELRNSTATKHYKDKGYSFAYTYHSQSRPDLVLYDLLLTKKDYTKK